MLDPREEIKDRLAIYDLVSDYVELKKAGRNFKGLCPFHSEKTPSFVVSPEKGLAYCFGCNNGGDIFAFYQLVEGCDFPEALQHLAERVNVELPKQIDSAKAAVNKSQKEHALALHELAMQIYRQQMLETEAGNKVHKYVLDRGLDEEVINRFQIGYSPDQGNLFVQAAYKENYSPEALQAAGLANNDSTVAANLYDRFRQRLMIPIRDQQGHIVAFGGRALAKDQQPKYLNSADTIIYNKSQVLFGLHFAKDLMRKERQVYLVEGYFDVMAFHQIGVTNVVATCGTALTDKQISLLKRYVDKVIFAFDADSAGRDAFLRGAEMVLKQDLDVEALYWEDGKDPADLVKDNPESLRDLLAEGKLTLIDFIWQIEFASKSADELASVEFVNGFLRRYLLLIHAVKSPVKRDLIVRKFAQFLQTEPRYLYDELKSVKVPKLSSKVDADESMPVNELAFEQSIGKEDFFWGYLFFNLAAAEELWPEIQKWERAFVRKDVYKAVIDAYNTGRRLDELKVDDLGLSEPISARFNQISLYLESKQVDLWSKSQLAKELSLLLKRLVDDFRQHRLATLRRDINTAEAAGDKERLQALLQEFNDVMLTA